MNQKQAGTPADLRTKLLGQIYGIAAMMVLSWVPEIAVVVFHHDLVGSDSTPSAEKAQAYFWLGMAVTVAGPFFIWRAFSKIKTLARSGVRMIATIVKISAASNHGIRPVTFSFQVGPLAYTIKRDTPELLLRSVLKTRQVPVIYDPANPNSCEILFPSEPVAANAVDERSTVGKWQEILAEPLGKGLFIVAFWGALLLTAVVIRAMGADVSAYGATVVLVPLLVVLALHVGWMLWRDRSQGRPDSLVVRTRIWEYVALGVLLFAVPASVLWTWHDQAAAAAAQQKHDQEDLENAKMMNPNLR